MRRVSTRAAWTLIVFAIAALTACAQGKVITDPILYPAVQRVQSVTAGQR